MPSKLLLSCFALPLLFSANASSAVEMQVDFAISFNQSYDFSTSVMAWTNRATTATVTLNLDSPVNSSVQYWGSQTQGITSYFGQPSVSSPMLAAMPQRSADLVWRSTNNSSAILTNIDYSISWPETFLGTGPKVTYQFNDSQSFQAGSLLWQQVSGFNLASPVSVSGITPRTADDLIDFVMAAYASRSTFSTGFTGYLLNLDTHQNVYGQSYLGTATITDIRETSPIPEPKTILLFVLGLLGLGTMHRRRKIPS